MSKRSLSKTSSEPDRALSAVDFVVARITDDIRNATYTGGDRLVEAEIMKSLSVSRSSVREAIRQLTADGLVQIERNKGARIRTLTREETLALDQVREMLEGLAARLAAGRINLSEYQKRMKSLMKDMKASESSGDWRAYRKQNSAFHDLILEMSGNETLQRFARQLQLHSFRVQFDLPLSRFAAARSLADHEKIVRAILDGDGGASERAMRAHIARTNQWIMNAPSAVFEPDSPT
ncbi:GntR family transcriptional regulator [Pseudorhodoplanes sp.]|uniref:GntR family transcriptional regulator n=1 Tax=Pseudorhodoplanes sp. TaxID=1934341 RepID=UPI003D13BBE0